MKSQEALEIALEDIALALNQAIEQVWKDAAPVTVSVRHIDGRTAADPAEPRVSLWWYQALLWEMGPHANRPSMREVISSLARNRAAIVPNTKVKSEDYELFLWTLRQNHRPQPKPMLLH